MRSVLLYLLLVGAPAALLLAILNAGRGLQAPPSVGGGWGLESAGAPAGTGPVRLDVTQSGEHVEVRIDSAVSLRGRLRGDSIVALADASRAGDGAGCAPARATGFRARVDGGAGAARMTGTLAYADPRRCPSIRVTAARLPRPARGGGGH